jgi:hypothetical protein
MTHVPEARNKVNVLRERFFFKVLKYFVKYWLQTFPFSHICYREEHVEENVNIALE